MCEQIVYKNLHHMTIDQTKSDLDSSENGLVSDFKKSPVVVSGLKNQTLDKPLTDFVGEAKMIFLLLNNHVCNFQSCTNAKVRQGGLQAQLDSAERLFRDVELWVETAGASKHAFPLVRNDEGGPEEGDFQDREAHWARTHRG